MISFIIINNKLKHYLSFFFELPVTKVAGQYNLILEVTYAKGRYKLTTPKAVYSYEDLYTVFLEGFNRINIKQRAIKKVLILGYGLGSIPVILKKRYGLDPQYTAIEIDRQIVQLAKKYGTLNNIQLICADAYEYVMQSNNPLSPFIKGEYDRFDLINIDLFIDNIVPEQFEQENFLLKIKKMLSDNGILLYNRLATKKMIAKTQSFYNQTFKKVFPQAKALSIGENLLFVSS